MNYLIIDDEPQARKLLEVYMSKLSGYQLVGSCASAMEAYEAMHAHAIDFMFLDIKMPVISGVEFLRSLKQPPMVIFTTAYDNYAVEGFDLNGVDYLLKPIALPRLIQALERLKERTAPVQREERSHLFVKVDKGLVKINLKDILLIEGLQNYVKIHLEGKAIVASCSLKTIEDMLPERFFIRVHRSYILPVAAIESVQGNLIETKYRAIPIGASYRSDIMEYLKHPL